MTIEYRVQIDAAAGKVRLYRASGGMVVSLPVQKGESVSDSIRRLPEYIESDLAERER